MTAGNGNGRDANGRFAAGNPGGPGRRPGDLAAYREALAEALAPEKLRRILAALARKAERGDVAACRVLLPLVLPAADKLAETELEARLAALEALVDGAARP